MKTNLPITVDEIAAFMNQGWPGEDWHLETDHEVLWENAFHHNVGGALYQPREPGRVVDLAGFDGRVRWQGRGADPTRGRGHRLSDLITRWRQRSTATVVVAYVPKTKLAEVTTWLEQAGCPLSTAVATEVDPRAA